MAEIQFPLSTAPGINATENGGRVINAFVDKAPEGSRSKVIWRRGVGLNPALVVGGGSFRGALRFDTQLITINDDQGYSTTKAGAIYTTSPLVGTVSGTGPVIMARNMRATPQVAIVTSAGAQYLEAGVIADLADPDLPQPTSVCFKDGFFVWSLDNGKMIQSGLNDITVAGTDYATAEAKPDGITRVVSGENDIVVFGEFSTEFWGNTGNETGFSFSRTAVAQLGLFGKYAVTGFEDGWTGELYWVAGDNSVRRRNGYSGDRVSEPDLEHLIAQITDKDSLIASSYVIEGHACVVLSCDDWTWVLDTSTGKWHERVSNAQTRWRAQFHTFVFDEWLAFDNVSAAVFRMDAAYNGGITPSRTVNISWSFDGGVTFGTALNRTLGASAASQPIDIFRCGLTKRHGVQWKLGVANAVYEDAAPVGWEVRSTQAHRFPGRAEIKRVSFDFAGGLEVALMGGAMDIVERAA